MNSGFSNVYVRWFAFFSFLLFTYGCVTVQLNETIQDYGLWMSLGLLVLMIPWVIVAYKALTFVNFKK